MTQARINIVHGKSVLNRTNLPGVDYSVNPYVGCEHACVYCYAANMRRYTGHSKEPWGEFLDVKLNAPEVLQRQLRRRKRGLVLVGSVTDPYTPAENEFMITRGILEALLEVDFPVTVLTKSDLVTRDLDLFRQFTDARVGFTINHLDPGLTRVLEPGTPPVERRIQALNILDAAGVATYVFIAPVIPFITDVDAIAQATGAMDIRLDRLNIGSKEAKSWLRLKAAIQAYDPGVIEPLEAFLRAKKPYYASLRAELEPHGYTIYF
jgi:DNA repair photolyase